MDQSTGLSADGRAAHRTKGEISSEQFVPDHLFLYILGGELRVYDGSKSFTLQAQDCHLVRKNRLVRYDKESGGSGCEMVLFCFEEEFLKTFQEKHKIEAGKIKHSDTFVNISRNKIIPGFVRSLKHYSDDSGKLADVFADVKHEELLIILLQHQPELAGILFDYGTPGKISLEKFMNNNFKFNVSLLRLAFLTGRSLSAFKRDFKAAFNETPSRWLMRKRLQEAYFLIDKKSQRPSDVYLDLGFRDLSHFSFAFKNQFGLAPSELLKKKHIG